MAKKLHKIGHLSNPLHKKIGKISVRGKSCKIIVPARVNTFFCHYNFFVNPPRTQVYPVSSINFAISKFTEATVTVRDDRKIVISASGKHLAIIEHAVKIMQKTLGIENGFDVNANNLHKISHGGLGSSSAIMSAVAQAINILMGNNLSVSDMTKLISQNYGEESSKKGFISSAASIGGSTAIGLSGKSLVVIGGESRIWHLSNLPKEYCAVLLYPKKLKEISKATDNVLNKKDFSLYDDWGDIRENMLKMKIIPTIDRKDYSVLFKAINMYTIGAYGSILQYYKFRWMSYNIHFDSLIYSVFFKIFRSLKIGENCFFVSSNGPMIVVITKYPKKVTELLEGLNKDYMIEKVALYTGINYQLKK